MPTKEKALSIQELHEKLGRVKSVVLADYRGINVVTMTKLRAKMRDQGVEFRIAKNTLTRIAAHEVGIEGLDPFLEGPTAIAFGYDDPTAPARVLKEFLKTNKKLQIKAGLVDGRVIDVAGVNALADLPSREVLLSMVLAGMQAPLTGMANVLQGPILKMGYALDALLKSKEQTA